MLNPSSNSGYLDHHPMPYSVLAQWGGRDITAVFDRNHSQPLTSLNIGDAKCTIDEVGRLLPIQTTISRTQVVLSGYVFAIDDLSIVDAVQKRWAGKVVSQKDWTGEAGDLFDALWARQADAALAKHEPRQPGGILGGLSVKRYTMAELAEHGLENRPTGRDAWIAVYEGQRRFVYDVSGKWEELIFSAR